MERDPPRTDELPPAREPDREPTLRLGPTAQSTSAPRRALWVAVVVAVAAGAFLGGYLVGSDDDRPRGVAAPEVRGDPGTEDLMRVCGRGLSVAAALVSTLQEALQNRTAYAEAALAGDAEAQADLDAGLVRMRRQAARLRVGVTRALARCPV